jgi:nucleoside-diphosphate-sugar epimerase
VCNVYDKARLVEAVDAFRPDLLMHQLTDLPDDVRELAARRDANARIRVEGTRNLIDAAVHAGVRRFLAQSIAWPLPPGTGADAVAFLERSVLAVDGVVLRYGQLYGPGTYFPTEKPAHPRIHIDAAAQATMDAIGHPSGVIVVVEPE